MRTRTKIGIGFIVVLALFVGLIFWAKAGLSSFLYPVAPAMPPEVPESMTQILTRLEQALQTNAPFVLAELQPGLSDSEIALLERQNGITLPEDIKAIYRWHNGSPQATNNLPIDFIPTHRFMPLHEALAERSQLAKVEPTAAARLAHRIFVSHRDSWLSILSDGAGDGYWYDPKRAASQGAVFYNFTEDATFVFFPSAKNLMAGIVKCYEQGAFKLKQNSSPPELDEDFDKAEKIWPEFGVFK